MYTMLSFVDQVFYMTYDTIILHTTKKTTHDALDDSTRILHQATTSCQSSPCSPLNVSYLRGGSWGSWPIYICKENN